MDNNENKDPFDMKLWLEYSKHIKNKKPTLSEIIYKFMRKKGIDDPVDVWKPIGLGRKNWHNLITRYENEEGKRPKKETLLWLAIGLRLDAEETKELLESQGYTTKD